LLLAALLWLLPVNWYDATQGFRACDPDGLAISLGLLLLGIVLVVGAVALVLIDKSASPRRRRILLAVAAAICATHLARGPELLREHAWTEARCDVGPMPNRQ
jgi:hypothetical protein